jgi:hypothetical protein
MKLDMKNITAHTNRVDVTTIALQIEQIIYNEEQQDGGTLI